MHRRDRRLQSIEPIKHNKRSRKKKIDWGIRTSVLRIGNEAKWDSLVICNEFGDRKFNSVGYRPLFISTAPMRRNLLDINPKFTLRADEMHKKVDRLSRWKEGD
ncbi:hypothetical protein KFK09_005790 [Dendrobium nobile]|uniref:Uncharacterized protein n=1 Tax=Dendrobium nobile TaxID=94219 RepID=A0A8T3C227_DENNO|nr:hypothetical protein KFK09_005790 [Dendrobium nobile]